MILASDYKPANKNADDIVLDILVDIEKKSYIDAAQTIRLHTYMDLRGCCAIIKKLAKEELNIEILKSINV